MVSDLNKLKFDQIVHDYLGATQFNCLDGRNFESIERIEYNLFAYLSILSKLKKFEEIANNFSLTDFSYKIKHETMLKNDLIYQTIINCLEQQGAKVFPILVRFACCQEAPLDKRAYAIKKLARYSKQKFDRNLCKDAAYWKEDELRIQEILEWQKQGYPIGEGYEKPKQDPSLTNPSTQLEVFCAALQEKLTKELYDYDPANPSGLLIIGNEGEIDKLTQKWRLPAIYLEFLKRFYPFGASLRRPGNDLGLHNAETIIDFNSYWKLPPEYLPIADEADCWIYALDLSKSDGIDAPVVRTRPEKFSFKKYKNSFLEFLQFIGN